MFGVKMALWLKLVIALVAFFCLGESLDPSVSELDTDRDLKGASKSPTATGAAGGATKIAATVNVGGETATTVGAASDTTKTAAAEATGGASSASASAAVKPRSTYKVPSPLIESREYYESLLDKFGAAFNAHDADMLASMVCEDALFRMSMGHDNTQGGFEIWGRLAIGKAFNGTFDLHSDSLWLPRGPSFVTNSRGVGGAEGGDKGKGKEGGGGPWRGVSEWTFVATKDSDGTKFNVDGVDLFTFRDGLISIKDAYRKDIPPKKPYL